jgi:hypothetical protein
MAEFKVGDRVTHTIWLPEGGAWMVTGEVRSVDYLGFGVGYGVKWDASFGLPLPVVAKAESLRLM